MIPAKVLEQHIAILGKTGSGKTYTAKGIAEGLLSKGQRVCIVDPTGVWWGLRSDSTGKKPAFPVVVFGGNHADAPLGQQHGSAIAEIIGTSDLSAILDTRLMTVGERTRFFTDFGETLLRKNVGTLHLIIDEAHLFAPQGKVTSPQSGAMLHAANNLVSLGRGIGLRIIMISQRPAKLHKDSLTQVETLIAMRLIAPQDRGAVHDWIAECADEQQGKEIIKSLASMPTGEGWLWAPELGILERKHFPKITTYDSSRAPDGASSKVVLASIDLPTIQSKLESVASDAFANDPGRLRKRIAELEKSQATPVQAPLIETKVVEKPILTADQLARIETAIYTLKSEREQHWNNMERYIAGLAATEKVLEDAIEWIRAIPKQTTTPPHAKHDQLAKNHIPFKAPSKARVHSNGDLGRVDRKLIDALGELHTLGVHSPPRSFIAMMCGFTNPKSGGFTEAAARLNKAGLILYPDGDTFMATEAGISEAVVTDAPSSAKEFQQKIIMLLSSKGASKEAQILPHLIAAYPDAMDRAELGQLVGFGNPKSGGFTDAMATLRNLGFVDYPNGQQIVALPTLFIGKRH